jgi:hypothetical protein
MSRLFPISYGAGVILVPDPVNPTRDTRVVKPSRVRKESRRARV